MTKIRQRLHPSWRTGLLLGALLLSTAALASDAPTIPFEKYTLDNGLEVILHQDKALPLVAVNVWYHVGAYHEPAGRTGFAHLFEHMMFQGSAHVGDDVHIGMLEGIGASELNGTTSFDRTNYFETVPANHLETALWLESDRMGFLPHTLTKAKLDNQRGVVQNERRQGTETQPYGMVEEKLWHTLFPLPHPYHGDVIGSLEDLDRASVADVRGFFETWYAPSNATLTLAGDFEIDQAKALIQKYFGTLPKRPKPTRPEVKPVAIAKEIVLNETETMGNLSKVYMTWLTPPLFAEGDATADVLASVLTSGKASRLEKKLVRELQIAQSVSAYQQSAQAQSAFRIEATARPGVDPAQLQKAIDEVLDEIRKEGVSAAEVNRAVSRYETMFWATLQRLGGFGGRADMLQTYNHYFGDPGWLAQDIARYRAVTPDAVKALVATTLTRDKRVVLIAVPKAAPASKEAM